MRTINLLFFTLVTYFASGAADAQQQAPQRKSVDDAQHIAHARNPPSPKSTAPTLDFTMEYIQEKLISRGILNYEVFVHDNSAESDWSYQFSDKLSGTYANASTCQVGFHWRQTRSGQVVTDKEMYFDLGTSSTVDVVSMDQYLTEEAVKNGHPSWTTKVSPVIFVLRISKQGNQENNLVFPDEELANHLAKALVHAIELCGSAQAVSAPAENKEPF